jgi:zinc protease
MRTSIVCLAVICLGASVSSQSSSPPRDEVTRATLDNGLRVVIVRDPLAPVVTVEENYLVGANETPTGFPGTAHAQEHMAFRGCAGLSGDQTAAIYAQLGGAGNADTQQNITQYFTTVEAADLDIVLRLDAACMEEIEDAQAQWALEKGAIEQEVARDLSEPTYRFVVRANEDLFAGTPYAHDALGTRSSFEATTADQLRQFATRWYVPNNAILVVTGDVDPQAALARIRALYGSIDRRAVPTRPVVALGPVRHEHFTLKSNLPYTLAFVAYRLPGTDSPDYAAAVILADVLASRRADLYGLVPAGQALDAEFELAETYPKASAAFGAVAVPSGTDPAPVAASMVDIIDAYARNGVPPELVDAAKRGEIASAAFQRNSIPGLAAEWSEALAAEGRQSPDEDVEAIRRVTTADVDRVARRFLVDTNSISATLVPAASGASASSRGFGGGERLTSAPAKPVELPPWAESALSSMRVPALPSTWHDTTLPNGLRVIVDHQSASPTVTVLGNVRHESGLQTPTGQEGVADVLGDLFDYGTTTLDRVAFQKALDDIAATETAGYDFSLQVLKAQFSRGVDLLADNILRPALPAGAFHVVQRQTADFLAGQRNTPAYRAERALLTGLLPKGDPGLREPTPKTVEGLTLADVKQYRAKTFRPDLTTIVVIGDVTPADADATVAKAFGEWRASGPKPALDLPAVHPNAATFVQVPDPSAVQASVTLAEEVGVTRLDPDYYALQLGNHVLGGGFYATRLYHDLREETGYVYTVDVNLASTRTRSVYSVSYGSDLQNVAKARDLIQRDLQSMRTDDVTPAELRQAKALLLRQIPLSASSEHAVAAGLLGRAQMGLALDEPEHAARRYASMTPDAIRDAFTKWIRPNAFVEVLRGPAARSH